MGSNSFLVPVQICPCGHLASSGSSEELQEYFRDGLRPPGRGTQAAGISDYWFSSATPTTTFTNKKLLVVVFF